MPYTVDWIVPGAVLFLTTSGKVTAAELSQLDAEVVAKLNESNRTVHLISDPRTVTAIEPSITSLTRSIELIQHPRIGWVVSLKTHKVMVDVLAVALTRLSSLQVVVIPDTDAAIEYLKDKDPTLASLV